MTDLTIFRRKIHRVLAEYMLSSSHSLRKYPDLRFQEANLEPGLVIHGGPGFRPVNDRLPRVLAHHNIQHTVHRGGLFVGYDDSKICSVIIPLDQPENT